MVTYRRLAIFTFLISFSALFLFRDQIQQRYFPTKDVLGQSDAKPISCGKDDAKCIRKNAVKLTHQLTGMPVEFAKHQCSGLHGCITPDEKSIAAATMALRSYTKNPNLQVIPVNGVTPAGVIYYCAKDGHCWRIETKTNTVLGPVKDAISPTPKIQPIRMHL
jgi:hypothetical protein